MDDIINRQLKNMLIITLQNVIARLGPVPDKLGDRLKRQLDGSDHAAFFALGCYIEDCEKEGDWSALEHGLDTIEKHQADKRDHVAEGAIP